MSERYPDIVYEDESYGKPYTQPYPWSWPEDLPRNAASVAVANSLVAFVGQGRLIGFSVTNTKASAQFILAFGTASVPADTAVPLFGIDIAANTFKAVYFGESGRWFHQGFVLCNSSTQATKTIGSADCLFDVQYVPQVI